MISNLNQNIFFWDASAETFTELTRTLNIFTEGTESLTFDVGDRLYIASVLPFNHRYFELSTANAVTTADLIIEYYANRSQWETPVRILDYTESANATFGKSGIVQFFPDDEYPISEQSDTDVMDQNFIDHAPHVYNMFWQAIGFSESVTLGIDYVGQLFASSDEDIYSVYPMLRYSDFLDQWKPGKTDWLQERINSTNAVIAELEKRQVILSRDQILDTARLREATVHHAAMSMFSGLGVDRFEKEIERASKRYNDAMNMGRYNVDKNADAMLSNAERKASTSRRSR